VFCAILLTRYLTVKVQFSVVRVACADTHSRHRCVYCRYTIRHRAILSFMAATTVACRLGRRWCLRSGGRENQRKRERCTVECRRLQDVQLAVRWLMTGPARTNHFRQDSITTGARSTRSRTTVVTWLRRRVASVEWWMNERRPVQWLTGLMSLARSLVPRWQLRRRRWSTSRNTRRRFFCQRLGTNASRSDIPHLWIVRGARRF